MNEEERDSYTSLNEKFVNHYHDIKNMINEQYQVYLKNETKLSFKDYCNKYFTDKNIDKFFDYDEILNWNTAKEARLEILNSRIKLNREIINLIENLNNQI